MNKEHMYVKKVGSIIFGLAFVIIFIYILSQVSINNVSLEFLHPNLFVNRSSRLVREGRFGILNDYIRMVEKVTDNEELLERFRQEVEDLKSIARRLKGKKILHINTSKKGGGVKEILESLVPLLDQLLGKDTVRWQVVEGPEEFEYAVKKLFNHLQGTQEIGKNELRSEEIESWYETNQKVAQKINPSEFDFIIIHDAGPLPIIEDFIKRLKSEGVKKENWPKFIWRNHMDTSQANQEVVDEYITGYIQHFHAIIYSDEKFKLSEGSSTLHNVIIKPAISPLSKKNRPITDEKVKEVLEKYGVNPDIPIILQVSRFDRFKGQDSTIEVFKKLRREKGISAQLVLIGGESKDDPQSPKIRQHIADMAARDKDIYVLPPVGSSLKQLPALDVNAFQKAADVVVQPSTREGFGLTVTEALWKETPVVGAKRGGIPTQIIDKEVGGYLVDPDNKAEIENGIFKLLTQPKTAQQLGKKGREHVIENFLITRLALDHLKLFAKLLGIDY